MSNSTETPEPKCADCGHGTLAHNAIGGACTLCECGHFRPVPVVTIGIPAAELLPGQVVRFADGTPEQNGDRVVGSAVTRHGTGYAFTRITWADGADCDFPASEELDVVAADAKAA